MKPENFEDACKHRGYTGNILPDAKHQKAITAYAKLLIIAEAINEGWEPDWNNRDEYKYFPWFDMEVDNNNPSGFRFFGTIYGYANAGPAGGSRLCFKTPADAEYAAKEFLELWRDMMVIEK